MAKKQYSFDSSKTAVNKDMPLFLTKFIVTDILPVPLREKYGAELLTESIVSMTGLDLDKMPEQVEQMFRGQKRRFGGTVADTNVDLVTKYNVNVTKSGVIYPLNIIRDWCRLIWNKDGLVVTKEEYSGSRVIEIHNVKGEVLRKVQVPIIFPQTNINEMELTHNEDNIYELEMTWTAENAKDVYIG